MLPDPLHPAVVHFPVVLAALLPLFAIGGLIMIRRDAAAHRAWALPVVVALALAGSAWLALETGEDEEDRVEEVVGEEPIHEHEEAAERFLILAAVLAVVAGGGLLGGTLGAAARVVTTVGSLGVLAAGIQTGDLGGELVYVHGAGSAYVDERPGDGPMQAGGDGEDEGEGEEEDEGEEARAGGAPGSDRVRVALPGLYRVMAGLEAEMARIDRGLWAGRADTVAAGAAAIAEHPRAPERERRRIAGILGERVAGFQEVDQRVHETASSLAEAARAGELGRAAELQAELQRGCLDCHTAFRAPIRAAVEEGG